MTRSTSARVGAAVPTETNGLPVAVIGAGPIGLAAAAHLQRRGLPFVVLEAGAEAAASVREWSHVRLFSPWSELVDDVAADLLSGAGWVRPDAGVHPLGGELLRDYLEPLAGLPVIADRIQLGARVQGVTRYGADRLRDRDRDRLPFELVVERAGTEERLLAQAVIDASGTWDRPNPLGPGLPAPGEAQAAAAGHVRYRIPDALGDDRPAFAGVSSLVVGSGHSAFNAVVGLGSLAAEVPSTRVIWAVRSEDLGAILDGGDADPLAERARLGDRARALVSAGVVEVVTGFRTAALETGGDDRVTVLGTGVDGSLRSIGPVDRVVALTGFRPDHRLLEELRVDLDPVVGTTPRLAPLIDPNIHSCGTVRVHGAAELAHPEKDLYVVGMKSYGRAPTFLLRTGYEQLRSVVAVLGGDDGGRPASGPRADLSSETVPVPVS